MTDKLIEAVAKSIYESDHAGGEDAVNVAQWKALPNIVGMEQARAEYIRCARAALAAIEASGYRVVPKEPTREMIRAASHAWGAAVNFTATEHGTYDETVWPAMLAAAPKVTP